MDSPRSQLRLSQHLIESLQRELRSAKNRVSIEFQGRIAAEESLILLQADFEKYKREMDDYTKQLEKMLAKESNRVSREKQHSEAKLSQALKRAEISESALSSLRGISFCLWQQARDAEEAAFAAKSSQSSLLGDLSRSLIEQAEIKSNECRIVTQFRGERDTLHKLADGLKKDLSKTLMIEAEVYEIAEQISRTVVKKMERKEQTADLVATETSISSSNRKLFSLQERVADMSSELVTARRTLATQADNILSLNKSLAEGHRQLDLADSRAKLALELTNSLRESGTVLHRQLISLRRAYLVLETQICAVTAECEAERGRREAAEERMILLSADLELYRRDVEGHMYLLERRFAKDQRRRENEKRDSESQLQSLKSEFDFAAEKVDVLEGTLIQHDCTLEKLLLEASSALSESSHSRFKVPCKSQDDPNIINQLRPDLEELQDYLTVIDAAFHALRQEKINLS